MKDNMMLNSSHKAKRDLLTGMDYERDTSLVTQRECNYDALGRPMTRDTRHPNKAIHHADTFAYNKRGESPRGLGVGLDNAQALPAGRTSDGAAVGQSAQRLAGRLDKSAAFAPKGWGTNGARSSQLTGALLDENAYAYACDNIGNREIAQEVAEGITYAANDLNQYTRISTNGENFTPEYDEDGNQTLIQTSTGIWKVQYNGQNRAIKFESEGGRTVITCGYDYMGHRFEKKATSDGAVTLHERYIYRGYLRVAAYDLREGHAEHPDLRFTIWDPTQEVATRPLAIRESGVWYTYGWDLTKNICELYGQEGFIRTIYTYSPYGQVTAEGDVIQPIQWSSEYHDAETDLVYYNYRYYNPRDGRWTRRDPAGEFFSLSLYCGLRNALYRVDCFGLSEYALRTCEKIPPASPEQKQCKYQSSCSPGYYWSDVGTPSDSIVRPCSCPDIVYSGTCKRKRKRHREPIYQPVPAFDAAFLLRERARYAESGAQITKITIIVITFLMIITGKSPIPV